MGFPRQVRAGKEAGRDPSESGTHSNTEVNMKFPKQSGKKDVVKVKGKPGYSIKLKSGGTVKGGSTVDAAKKRVQQIVYFRDKGH